MQNPRGLIFSPSRKARPYDQRESGDEIAWIDIVRGARECSEALDQQLGARLHDRHLADIRNTTHPPFFDSTDEYDLLIVRAADPGAEPEDTGTRSIALLVTANVIITIHDRDDATFDPLYERLSTNARRSPLSTPVLLHLLLNEIIDRLLAMGEPVAQRLDILQTRLLDTRDPFDDWRLLMHMRTGLRTLAGRMARQRSVLDEWREQTLLPIDRNTEVRFNDLTEHLSRVEHQADVLQDDVDSLLNIYFAAASQRTNKVVQFLAVISAIFLPLTLIAGVFGMNFDHLPLLRTPWGAYGVLGGMAALGLLLWFWFKRNRWL
ncbi:MAG: magnesium transporter CorA family protein [Gammaproteobacteria bacterium]|nr:magnesium transporter CorA family protein [Gammaproteobacteria bacterium]